MIRGLGEAVRPGSEHFCPSRLALCPSMFQCPLAVCLHPWPAPSPSSPAKQVPCPIYHLTSLLPVRWFVTSQLRVTTFPGSGMVSLSASKLPWPPENHTPRFNPLTRHQAKGLIPSAPACSAAPYTGLPTAPLSLLQGAACQLQDPHAPCPAHPLFHLHQQRIPIERSPESAQTESRIS